MIQYGFGALSMESLIPLQYKPAYKYWEFVLNEWLSHKKGCLHNKVVFIR